MAEPFDGERRDEHRIALGPQGRNAPPREVLTSNGFNAVSYFAIGVASEGGRNPYALSFAGSIGNDGRMRPVERSGLTIGTLQIDLGQRPAVARELVDAYQDWARPNDRMTVQGREQAIRDLSRNGDAIRADNGRPMDAVSQTRINTFLASEAGINFVHRHDALQAQTLAREVYAPLESTRLFSNASFDDQVRIATVMGKLHNQNPGQAERMFDRIENNEFRTFGQLNNAITAIGGSIRDGRDDALQGAEVLIALHHSDRRSPLRDDWGSVVSNPLVNPTDLDANNANRNLPRHYAVIKELFLQHSHSPEFIEALNRGGDYRIGQTSRNNGERFVSDGLYASGNNFVVWNTNGHGIASINGVYSEFDRNQLRRVNNPDGTIDLQLERNGRRTPLLHIDPDAPDLRPVAPQPRGQGRRASLDIEEPGQSLESRPRTALMSDPGFDASAHRTWSQTSNALDRAPIEGLGDLSPQQRERLAANVAANVVGDVRTGMTGVTRIDASTIVNPQTGLPQYVIAGQGDPTTAHYKRVAVDLAQAIDTTVERSSEIAKAGVDAREQARAQTIAQAQTLQQEAPNGPTMTIGGRTIGMAGHDGSASGAG